MFGAEPRLVAAMKKISGKSDISKIRLYKGAGCKVCDHTGYFGRSGIFEVLEMTEEIKPLISQKASADILETKAKELGMTTMLEDGIKKSLQGVTTLEEIIRVTKI